MAVIKPFKALRPTTEYADKIAALPYDVYSREEAYSYTKEHPLSFLNIDRPETQFDRNVDMYSEKVYQEGGRLLKEMEEKKIFQMEQEECFYIYEQTFNERTQTGLAVCSSVDDYLNNVIKKHEKTVSSKEKDRINHVNTCNAQSGPIFLAYPPNQRIKEIVTKAKMNTPIYDFVSEDKVTQRMWKISDTSTIQLLVDLFGEIPSTYIADGHHRAASAVAVSKMRREKYPHYTGTEEFNYFLSVLFPADELYIMDYNRVLKKQPYYMASSILEGIKKVCDVLQMDTKKIAPSKPGTFSMLLDNTWYLLQEKESFQKSDAVEALDVAFLQREILAPLFGIEDPKTDERIAFIGGIRGLKELEMRVNTDCVCAFAMYPTSIYDLFAVADANKLMPPKSTWFEPKLLSGLLIHKIES